MNDNYKKKKCLSLPPTPIRATFIDISFTKCNSTWNDETYRRNFSYIMRFKFNKQQTLKSVHLQLFEMFYRFFETLIDKDKLLEEVYEDLFINGEEK